MAISAMLLFGSRAREDHARGSDTDLLLIVPESPPRHVSVGQVSMFYYPWSKLLADATRGDLFLCHLTKEAKPLFDPSNKLAELRASFKLKVSYTREIEQASDLGWYLVRFGGDLDPSVLARRMIWCVRTILIARSAEAGAPVFAPQALASSAGSDSAQALLEERHQRRADAKMRYSFKQFLIEESYSHPWHQEGSVTQFIDRFAATSNDVALQTLQHGGDHEESIYR